MTPRPSREARRALALLTFVYMLNFLDRQLVGILAQPIKGELKLSDAQIGLLSGTAFVLLYLVAGLPIARIAERRSRVKIIALSLAAWSAMTACCGLAGSFGQMLLARIGVGIGEAGCTPASQSLVADLYPPGRRTTAISILMLGVPLGMLLAGASGGSLADALGWRGAFLALGLPGLLIAGVVAMVPEPPRGDVDQRPPQHQPPLGLVMATLLRTPVFRHMALGGALASFAGYGLTGFAVPLAVRSFGLPLHVAAGGFGLVAGAAMTVGITAGGVIADRWQERRPNAPALVAAGGVLAGCAAYQLALSSQSAPMLALTGAAPLVLAHMYFGPAYGSAVSSVGAASRATAVAAMLLIMNGIGLGLGPLAVGKLSDIFASEVVARCGEPWCQPTAAGLRSALRVVDLIYLWSAVHFLLAARALRRDQPQRIER